MIGRDTFFSHPDWAEYSGRVLSVCPLPGWDFIIYVYEYGVAMPFKREELL